MTKYVYSFGNGTADGDGKMKDVLGGKGAGLAEMCRAKLPVPPGFTISTQVCNIYFQNGNVVLEVSNHDFDQIFEGQKKKAKAHLDTELTAADLQEVIAGYKKLVEKKTGKPFPQDALQQLAGARDAVFRSWNGKRAIQY